MSLPDPLPILPFTRPVQGEVMLPGSKSITNRALILGALGARTVTLTGALFSRDSRIMVAALQALGFAVSTDESARTITVTGRGGLIPNREAKIHVGNAGTAARFLTALVCLRPGGTYHFDSDAAMYRRPIGPLLDALATQGAKASAKNFPFTLQTAGLPGGAVEVDASESSQLLSALLLVAPHAKSPLTVKLKGKTVSAPFIAMTEKMLQQFAAQPLTYAIEGDATAASYFLTLPVVTGGRLALPNYAAASSLQGDVGFAAVLKQIGNQRRGVDADFNNFSDTFLTLAAIAPLLEGPTKITGIAHTRKQETDRVAGMARELRKLGQDVVETDDSLTITPRPLKSGVEIETYHDHRFAMSFAILGCHNLHGDGRSWLAIKDPGMLRENLPGFFCSTGDFASEVADPLMATHPFIIVAIDGGAASGKSSSSRTLSERFDLLHVDTGSYYRALTAELLRRGVTPGNLAGLPSALAGLQLTTRLNGRSAEMEIDGQVAGDEIRSREVNDAVSHFAAIPELRAALLAYQRGLADVAKTRGFRGLVMEGRDIGSVIFPRADFRFFLHADAGERERRRAGQGQHDQIRERDRIDSSRKASPLTCPDGATSINTTHVSLDQVVEQMAAAIATKLPPA